MAGAGKRILVGCAVGCGAALVVALVVVIVFAIWIGRPGTLLEPERLFGEETAGYAEWTLRLEDPGTRGFVDVLIAAARNRSDELERLPPWLGGWLSQMQSRKAEGDILKLFPIVLAWTVQPDEGRARDLHLVSISADELGNQITLVDMGLGLFAGRGGGLALHEHRDEKIYEMPLERDRRVVFFFRDTDLFFASSVPAARVAVDRLLRGTPGEVTRLDRLWAQLDPDAPLRGALLDEHGEWQRLSAVLLSPDAVPADLFDGVKAVALAGGLAADGSFRGKVDFVGPDARWAEERAAAVAAALPAALAWTEIEVEATAAATGDRVRVDLRLADLVGALHRLEQRDEGRKSSD